MTKGGGGGIGESEGRMSGIFMCPIGFPISCGIGKVLNINPHLVLEYGERVTQCQCRSRRVSQLATQDGIIAPFCRQTSSACR